MRPQIISHLRIGQFVMYLVTALQSSTQDNRLHIRGAPAEYRIDIKSIEMRESGARTI